jgi:hypothetical protein
MSTCNSLINAEQASQHTSPRCTPRGTHWMVEQGATRERFHAAYRVLADVLALYNGHCCATAPRSAVAATQDPPRGLPGPTDGPMPPYSDSKAKPEPREPSERRLVCSEGADWPDGCDGDVCGECALWGCAYAEDRGRVGPQEAGLVYSGRGR